MKNPAMKFVLQVKIKQGHTVEEYAEAWEQASAVIQKMPGARGTYLHRGIGDHATLLAIAEWDSKKARDQAMPRLQNAPASRAIIDRHLAYGDVSLVGEFEEPEWQVIP